MAHGQASIGVMFNTDRMSGRALRDFAAEIETLGVSTLAAGVVRPRTIFRGWLRSGLDQ